MTRTSDHRKSIPLGVRLHSVLLLLGYTDEEITGGGIQWDHCPALGLRFVDRDTGEMIPAPNDPRYIRPMRTAEHRVKTSGTKATSAGSDIHAIAKAKRGAKKQARHLAAVNAKHDDEAQEPPRPRSKWPRGRKLQSKNTFRRRG
ncbi:MAG: hypothetical protein AB7O39_03420 [Flavobacteriaceae bacterium]